MKVSEILREAADLIDKGGLFRGTDTDGDSSHCALTSIREIQRRNGMKDLYSDNPLDYLSRYLGFYNSADVVEWNDDSKDGEVQRVMREVADQYDRKHLVTS